MMFTKVLAVVALIVAILPSNSQAEDLRSKGLTLFQKKVLLYPQSPTLAMEIHRVASKINLTKKDTESVVGIIFQSITDSLSKGEKVELRGFGSFRIRQRNARTGRNPRSGETVEVPSRKVPFFKAGKDLIKMVDNKDLEAFRVKPSD